MPLVCLKTAPVCVRIKTRARVCVRDPNCGPLRVPAAAHGPEPPGPHVALRPCPPKKNPDTRTKTQKKGPRVCGRVARDRKGQAEGDGAVDAAMIGGGSPSVASRLGLRPSILASTASRPPRTLFSYPSPTTHSALAKHSDTNGDNIQSTRSNHTERLPEHCRRVCGCRRGRVLPSQAKIPLLAFVKQHARSCDPVNSQVHAFALHAGKQRRQAEPHLRVPPRIPNLKRHLSPLSTCQPKLTCAVFENLRSMTTTQS